MASTGFDKIKDGLAQAVEPAATFAETGSVAQAAWSGVSTVLLTKILGPLSLITGGIMAMNGAMKLFLGRTEAVAKGIEKIRRLEMLKTQFQPLLGGAASAQAKIEELFAFAATTPFQMDEIAEAARTLEVLTKGGASGADSLRMIGDAAAVSGQSMQTVSFWVGRTFDALKNNAPIGEATARLQEMGLITGEVRRKLQASAEAGESFATTFGILKSALKESEGGMLELSKTLGGLESTLADVRAKFAAGFAKDFAVAEKANVRATIATLKVLEPVAQSVGNSMAFVTKGIASLKEGFANAVGANKTLGNSLRNAYEGFIVFAAAVAAVQIASTTKALMGLVSALKLSSGASIAAAAVQNVLAASGGGLIAMYKAFTSTLAGHTLAQKLAAIVGLGAIGVYKALALAIGMVGTAFKQAFAAMVANPLNALIATTVVLISVLLKVKSAAKDQADAMKTIGEAASEAATRVDELIASFKTVSDATAGFAQIESEIATVRKQIEDLIVKMSSLSAVDKFFGVDDNLKAQIDALMGTIDQLRGKLLETAQIEATQLKIGDAKIEQLRRQVELTSELNSASHDLAMSRATEAEQITLMVKRQQELKDALDVGRSAEQSAVVQDQINNAAEGKGDGSFPALEQAAAQANNAKDAIQEAENALQDFVAEQGKIEGDFVKTATQEDVDAGDALRVGQQILNKEGSSQSQLGVGGVIKFVDDEQIQQFDDLIKQVKLAQEELKAFEAAIKAGKADAAGEQFITPEAINELGQAGVSMDSLIQKQRELEESGSSAGLLAALKSRKANNQDKDGNTILDARQLQILEEAIQRLEKQKESINQNAEAVKRLKFQREELARQQQLSINLMMIERGLHQEMMSINERSFQVEQRKLNARIKAAQATLAEKSERGDTAASTARMEENLKELKSTDREGNTQSQNDNLDAQIAVLEKQIEKQKAYNNEVEAAQREVDRLKKQLKELEETTLQKLKFNIADIIATELDLSAEVAITLGNFDEAAASLEALNALNNEVFAQKRFEQLRSEGQSEQNASLIVAKEVQQREQKRENQRLIKTQSTEENLRIQQLETRATVFGDQGARNEAIGLRAKQDFRKEMQSNLAMGMSREDAVENAMKKIDTDLLSKVPEAKVTADSFRRIGAGGFAGSTDPMKLLAERRNKVLEALSADIRKMLNIDEEILKKDDNIRLG